LYYEETMLLTNDILKLEVWEYKENYFQCSQLKSESLCFNQEDKIETTKWYKKKQSYNGIYAVIIIGANSLRDKKLNENQIKFKCTTKIKLHNSKTRDKTKPNTL
jgi:hypothetical protein